MKESKIYDVVLFYNETEMLKRRISYLESSIEKFIVINFGNKTINFQHPQMIVLYDYKKKSDFFRDNFLLSLIRRDELKFLKPQDFLLISKTFEIPNKGDFPYITENPSQDVTYLFQKNIFWSLDFVSEFKYVGTRVFNITTILQNNLLYKNYHHQNLVLAAINKSIESGWSLQGFQSNEDFYHHINFWGPEKLRDKISNPDKVRYFKENILSFDYPTKISQLKIDLSPQVPEEFFGLTRDFRVRDPKDVFICLEDFEIQAPSKVLYGDYDYTTFTEVYKKNEVLRILKNEHLLLTDKIHIKEKTESEYSVFTYLEISQGIPSDMF